jgi:hypothetical protein
MPLPALLAPFEKLLKFTETGEHNLVLSGATIAFGFGLTNIESTKVTEAQLVDATS